MKEKTVNIPCKEETRAKIKLLAAINQVSMIDFIDFMVAEIEKGKGKRLTMGQESTIKECGL